jgi:hypothetical protein
VVPLFIYRAYSLLVMEFSTNRREGSEKLVRSYTLNKLSAKHLELNEVKNWDIYFVLS